MDHSCATCVQWSRLGICGIEYMGTPKYLLNFAVNLEPIQILKSVHKQNKQTNKTLLYQVHKGSNLRSKSVLFMFCLVYILTRIFLDLGIISDA